MSGYLLLEDGTRLDGELCGAVDGAALGEVARAAGVLVEGAAELGIPIVVT